MLQSLTELLNAAQKLPTRTVAVASADDADVLKSLDEATKLGLAHFLLTGDSQRIRSLASTLNIDWIKNEHILHCKTPALAAVQAVELVKNNTASTLMKGQLQTGTFLKAVLDKEKGLRGPGLLNQCGVYEKQGGGLILITDCAMVMQPDLDQKRQIVQNGVNLAHKLGIEMPKVAVVCALETINPDMPETIDAAVLCKMADRGQIKGCIIDGPFGLDNAVNMEAAEHKGLHGPVAGNADILLMPDLKTGNVLHKSLVYFSFRKNAALCLGAAAPIIMTSRTDPVATKVFSIALGCYTADM